MAHDCSKAIAWSGWEFGMAHAPIQQQDIPPSCCTQLSDVDAPQIAQNVAAGNSDGTNRGMQALRNSLTPIGAMNLLAKDSLSRSPLGSQHSTTPSHGDKKLHRCVVDEGSALEHHSRTLSSFKATTCRL